MLGLIKRFNKKKEENKKDVNIPETIDKIEAAVYEVLKPYGFRKHGRTLHRFVSGDISQVLHFQSGLRSLQGKMCVNVGIGIPECIERVFHPENVKKYYHEYECTMRSRLGEVRGKRETWYDLSKYSEKMTQSIIREIVDIVIPAFDKLSTREAILERRASIRWLHVYGSITLDECMIHGHLGNMEKARELFEKNYDDAVARCNRLVADRKRKFDKESKRLLRQGLEVTTDSTGYANVPLSHIEYLDDLAVKLGFR